MRKLLTHPVTFVVAILLVVGILFTGAKKVDWFSWFGLWTKNKHDAISDNTLYVQKTMIDETVMGIIQAHTILGKWLTSLTLPSWGGGVWGANTIPWFLAASQQLLMTDIVTYLENSSDRETALDTLVSQLQYYQDNGGIYATQLQEIIGENTAEYNRCSDAKTEADSVFYQWLREGDAQSMQQGMSDSQTHAACQASKRVIVNAHKAMLERIQKNTTVTANLLQLLTQNREIIITHFMLFKDTYLEKLITVRDSLRLASPGTN